MTKIVSQVGPVADRVERLRAIIASFNKSPLAVNLLADPDGSIDVDNLIDEVGIVVDTQSMTISTLLGKLLTMESDLVIAKMHIEVLEETLATLVEDIDYDEALDHATADLMDCMCSSGAADVGNDGDLIFDERVSFNREDIKPWLRQAIVRWIECRMSK